MTVPITFVTSVNKVYFDKYGRRLVASLLQHTPPEVTLRLYGEASAEGLGESAYDPGVETAGRVAYVDLFRATAIADFIALARPRVEQKMGGPVPADPDLRKRATGYDYRWDAVTFGKKAFSLSHALATAATRYLFWVDSDVVFLRPVTTDLLRSLFNGAGIVYFGREQQHSETGFVGFDLDAPGVRDFARAMATTWSSGELLARTDGWTDCHAFDAVLQDALARGELKARSLSREAGGHVMASSVLSPYLDHLKGERKPLARSPEHAWYHQHRLRWLARVGLQRLGLYPLLVRWRARRHRPLAAPQRYDQILHAIRTRRPRRILEVGTWNGARAEAMAEAALAVAPNVEYFGFDLFEQITDEISARELNVKQVPSEAEVRARLERFAARQPGFSFQLYRGFTDQTLPRFLAEHGGGTIDLVWLDGGHSIETVRSDWRHCYEATRGGGLLLLDDYYSEMPDEKLARSGCNALVERLRAAGELTPHILPAADPVLGGGRVQIVQVHKGARA